MTDNSLSNIRISQTKYTSNVENGEFDVLRIPDLDASKITTGTFDASMIQNLAFRKVFDELNLATSDTTFYSSTDGWRTGVSLSSVAFKGSNNKYALVKVVLYPTTTWGHQWNFTMMPLNYSIIRIRRGESSIDDPLTTAWTMEGSDLNPMYYWDTRYESLNNKLYFSLSTSTTSSTTVKNYIKLTLYDMLSF